MDFFNESYFRSFSTRMPLNEQRIFSEKVKGAPLSKEFDIFLSYNIADIDVVKGIYFYLTKSGFCVYLDFIVDSDLKRSETDAQTAKRIQTRLKNSKSLLYAQSPSAGQSNWMPWELGIVDGNNGKCMIMPVTKDASNATPKREYLLLYPHVKNELGVMHVLTDTDRIYGVSLGSYILKG